MKRGGRKKLRQGGRVVRDGRRKNQSSEIKETQNPFNTGFYFLPKNMCTYKGAKMEKEREIDVRERTSIVSQRNTSLYDIALIA